MMHLGRTEMNAIIEDAISKAVEDTNLQQEGGSPLLHDDNQLLIGEGGVLDSLGILIFVTTVESCLRPGMPQINLIDMVMVAENSAHFASIGALKRYLYSLA